MSCDPTFSYFYSRYTDMFGYVYLDDLGILGAKLVSLPFEIGLQNAGDQQGNIRVDFDAQPVLTTGSAATWKLVASVTYSNVNRGELREDEVGLPLGAGNALIRAVAHGDPAAKPAVNPEAYIDLVVV